RRSSVDAPAPGTTAGGRPTGAVRAAQRCILRTCLRMKVEGRGSVRSRRCHARRGDMGTMEHEVFISYSSQDRATAQSICGALEGEDIQCWIAPRDVMPGSSYPRAILDAIQTSRVVIV